MRRRFPMMWIVPILALSACGEAPANGLVAGPADSGHAADHRAFALDLFRQLAGQPGNLTLSPYGVENALGVLSLGAEARTAEALRRVLHGALPSALGQGGDGGGVHNANALWFDRAVRPNAAFTSAASQRYGAAVTAVDFADATGAAAQINRWFDEHTEHQIGPMVSPGDVAPMAGQSTALAVTNALYFSALWAQKFTKGSTTQQEFHPASGPATQVAMMHDGDHIVVARETSVDVLIRDFKWPSPLRMLIALPHASDGLPALIGALDAATIATWEQDAKRVYGTVSLPRLHTTSAHDLVATLKALGLESAFDPKQAGFQPITADRLAMWIGQFRQNADFKMDEEGARGVAETIVITTVTSAAYANRDEPFRFVADHPFLYLVEDRASGEVVFMGKVETAPLDK